MYSHKNKMCDDHFRIPYNNVLEYNVLQGVSHPSDLSNQILRDINYRYITVENSSPTMTVGAAITTSYQTHRVPPIAFYLKPGEIRHLGINPPGSTLQSLHLINPKNKEWLGDPYPLRTDANQFVIRHGINKFFIDPFKRPSYRAAF